MVTPRLVAADAGVAHAAAVAIATTAQRISADVRLLFLANASLLIEVLLSCW
jgi:hypothetical protein